MDGPPPAAVGLLLLLIATPTLVGLADPAGPVGLPAWGAIVWSLGLAVAVARARPESLLPARLVHGPVLLGTTLWIGTWGALGLAVAGITASGLAWRRDVGLAIRPGAPSPGVPIPPELVDPAIMEAADLDDRGRRAPGTRSIP